MAKKFKKLKNTTMVHFNPKSDGKCRERENIKSIVLFRSYPNRNRKFQKNSKKIKKYHYGFISSQNWMENAGKERIQKVSFCFVPTRREIENSNKIIKKFEKLKNTVMASFQAKIGWKRMRKRENKIIIKFRSCPTRN